MADNRVIAQFSDALRGTLLSDTDHIFTVSSINVWCYQLVAAQIPCPQYKSAVTYFV